MTVYELIQELARYEQDTDVKIEIEFRDKNVECECCGTSLTIATEPTKAEIQAFGKRWNDDAIYLEGREIHERFT